MNETPPFQYLRILGGGWVTYPKLLQPYGITLDIPYLGNNYNNNHVNKTNGGEKMNIIYTKNITFEYNCDRMSDKTFRKVVGKLSQNGVYLVSSSGTLEEAKYGYNTLEQTDSRYHLMIPSLSDEPIIDWRYKNDAVKSVEGLEQYFDEVYFEAIETTTSKKQWMPVEGSTITMIATDDTLFETPYINSNYTTNKFEYDLDIAGELTMIPMFRQDWASGLVLSFKLEWSVDDKQHPSMIAKVLDDMVLEDITSIKKIVDKVLKSKDFGIDVELEPVGAVYMHCWSNTAIDIKQECSLESRQKLGGSQ